MSLFDILKSACTYWQNHPDHHIKIVYFAPALAVMIIYAAIYHGFFFGVLPNIKSRLDSLTRSTKPKLSLSDAELLTKLKDRQNKFHSSIETIDSFFTNYYGRRIWSFWSFQVTLLVAFLYPILTIVLIWVVTGSAQVGEVELFTAGTLLPERIISALFLLLFVIGAYYIFLPQTQKLLSDKIRSFENIWKNRVVIRWCSVAIALSLAVAVSFAGEGNSATAYAFAGASLFFGAIAVAIAGAIAGAGTGAVTGAITFAFTLLVTFDKSLSAASALAVVFAIIVAVSVSLITGIFQKKSDEYDSSKRDMFYILLQWMLLAIICIISVRVPCWMKRPDSLLSPSSGVFLTLFFFGILPFINSLFDYVSIGLTRWLIRIYLRESKWKWALILCDVVSAIILSIILYVVIIFTLKGIETSHWGINTYKIFDVFSKDPTSSKISWITMLAFSNLIPTLLHLLLSLWCWLSGFMHASVENKKYISECLITLSDNPPLEELDAKKLLRYLYIERWLMPIFVISALWAFVLPTTMCFKFVFEIIKPLSKS